MALNVQRTLDFGDARKIINLPNPTSPQDAATKNYVDNITGVSDGDKGDIIVSASGATWTIDTGSVTYSKIQNVTNSRLLGRKTAGAGPAEEITFSEILDFVGSATHGDILYRGSTGWTRLPAGINGQTLRTGGINANPSWATVSAGGNSYFPNGWS